MARTTARLGSQPFEGAHLAVRHRPTRIRPCAAPAGGRAPGALGWGLVVLVLLGAAARAAEVAHDVPEAGGLFGEVGRGLLTGPPEAPMPPADLSLVWYDPSGGLEGAFPILADEVRSIFRGLGVEASWRIGGTYGGAALPEVPVILLREDPMRRRRSERVLGLVVPDQEPQRAVWAFLENLRTALGLGRHPRDPQEAEALARALGRVVAHEVIHAIAPEAPHAGEGLMRHALDKRFLVGPKATVDARCASAFVARLAAEWQLARARATAGGAPLSLPQGR